MGTTERPERPEPVIVPSDDCVITRDGREYHIHRGEWVKAAVGMTLGQVRLIEKLTRLQSEMAAVEGDSDEDKQVVRLLSGTAGDAAAVLRGRIVAWNWTDSAGTPRPQPSEPGAFDGLELEELFYLVAVLRNQAPAERSKDSRPSQTTSSATPRARSRT